MDALAGKFSKLENRIVSAGEVFDKISRREVSFDMVRDVLWDMTNEGGKFYMMQEVLTESLAGKYAKLQDSYEMMLSSVADNNNGILSGSIDTLTWLTEKCNALLSIVKAMAAAWGIYKAVMILTNTVSAITSIRNMGLARSAILAKQRLDGEVFAMRRMNAATSKLVIGMYRLKIAMRSLTMISGVLGALAFVGTIVYEIYQNSTKLQRSLHDIFMKSASSASDAKEEFLILIKRLDKLDKNSKDYSDTVDAIQSKYGAYLGNIQKEAYSYDTLSKNIDRVTEALRNKAYEEARQQGRTAIKEHFAEDISDYTKDLEGKLIGTYKIPKGIAKGIVLSFSTKIQELLNDGQAINPALLLDEMLKSYDSKLSTKGTDLARNNLYATVYKLSWKYAEMINETLSFDNTISKISTTSAEREAEKIAKIREKIFKSSMPKTKEGRNQFELETIALQLKAIEDMPDNGELKTKLNIRREALLNYGDAWVETVQKIRSSISKGKPDGFLAYLMPSDKQIENGQTMEWLNGLAPKYKEAKEQLEALLKIPKSLRNVETNSAIENNQNTKKFIELVFKAFDLDLASLTKGGDSDADKVLERIRERLNLIKDAYAEYKKWESSLGKAAAMVKVKESGLFSVLGENGIPTSLEEYKRKVESIRDDLKSAIANSNTKQRRDALRETFKVLLDIDYDINKSGMDKALDSIKTSIEETASKWNVFESIMDKTGNMDLSLSLAFGNIEVGENGLLKDLRKQIEDKLRSSGLSFDEVIDLDETELEEKGLKLITPLVNKYKDGLRELRKSTADSLVEMIEAYADYATKIAAIERKKERDIEYYVKNRTSLEKAGLNVDELIRAREKKAEEEKSSILFEKFKQDNDWARVFDDLDRVSNATLDDMIEKIELFAKKQRLSTEETKALMEALRNLRNEKTERNPFKALKLALDKIEDAKKKKSESKTDEERKSASDELRSAEDEMIEAIKVIVDKFKALTDATDFLGGVFESLGLGSGVSDVAGVMGSTANGANVLGGLASALGMTGPWGAMAGAALGLISGLAGLHDKGLEKKIQRSQLEVKKLENAYKSLSDTIEKQLGSVTESQASSMMGNLKSQRRELLNQMNLEKKKKKSDKGRIEDYGNQINEINSQIKYFYEELASDQYNASIKDWASRISDAITQAFKEGTDAAEAFDKAVAEIMSDVVGNMIRLQVIEPAMSGLRNFLFGHKGIFTEESEKGTDLSIKESQDLASQLSGLKDKISYSKDIWDSINEALKKQGLDMSSKDSESKSGLSQGIKGVTEDTASLIASYINAIRQDVSVKRVVLEKAFGEDIPKLGAIAQAQLAQTKVIAFNTGRNADLVQEIRDILNRNINGGNRFNI